MDGLKRQERNTNFIRYSLHSVNIDIFECDVCKTHFCSYASLEEHESTHHANNNLQGTDLFLKRQEKNTGFVRYSLHSVNIDVFECDICKKHFSRYERLEKHKREHAAVPECSSTSSRVCPDGSLSCNEVYYNSSFPVYSMYCDGSSNLSRELCELLCGEVGNRSSAHGSELRNFSCTYGVEVYNRSSVVGGNVYESSSTVGNKRPKSG